MVECDSNQTQVPKQTEDTDRANLNSKPEAGGG